MLKTFQEGMDDDNDDDDCGEEDEDEFLSKHGKVQGTAKTVARGGASSGVDGGGGAAAGMGAMTRMASFFRRQQPADTNRRSSISGDFPYKAESTSAAAAGPSPMTEDVHTTTIHARGAPLPAGGPPQSSPMTRLASFFRREQRVIPQVCHVLLVSCS